MAYYRIEAAFERPSAAELERWRRIPSSGASDSMNRDGAMAGAIKPLSPSMRLAGPARTVAAMVGDNGIIHASLAFVAPGDVLVIDSGGVEDVAVWGEVLTHAARARGLQGVVVDGASRDCEAIRALGFPVFCRAIAPRGPHKGFGGTIDAAVSVGGVSVAPGDIVIGDADGVAVVPRQRRAEVLEAAEAVIVKEGEWLRQIAAGALTAEIMGLPKPEVRR